MKSSLSIIALSLTFTSMTQAADLTKCAKKFAKAVEKSEDLGQVFSCEETIKLSLGGLIPVDTIHRSEETTLNDLRGNAVGNLYYLSGDGNPLGSLLDLVNLKKEFRDAKIVSCDSKTLKLTYTLETIDSDDTDVEAPHNIQIILDNSKNISQLKGSVETFGGVKKMSARSVCKPLAK
jgi:hypothetical protein